MKKIGDLTKWRRLTLSSKAGFDDGDLARVFLNMPDLEHLNIEGRAHGTDSLRSINSIKCLRSFEDLFSTWWCGNR